MGKSPFLAGTIMFCVTIAAAQSTLPPRFFDQVSETDNDSLTMKCEGTPPFTVMDCTFVGTSVTKPTPATFAKDQAATRARFQTRSEPDLKHQQGLICQDLARNEGMITSLRLPPGRAAVERRHLAWLKQLCACQNKACIVDAMVQQNADDPTTCTVSASTFTAHFQKVGQRKWISNNGPEGICGVVSVLSLEREEKYEAWTYTESTVTGNSDLPACQSFGASAAQPEVFSWKTGRAADMNCRTILFNGAIIGAKQ